MTGMSAPARILRRWRDGAAGAGGTAVDGARSGFGLPRPTLRLRLTLLNGVLLFAAGASLLGLAFLLLAAAFRPAEDGKTTLTLPNGQEVNTQELHHEIARTTERDIILKGVAGLVLISAAGVAGAYVVAGRALRPLHQVTATARRLSTETLDQRIRYSGPDDELRELADTFDAMLDRMSTAFEVQQRFVANASHELRTPLAVMRTEVDVTLSDHDADVAELRRMGQVVRDASYRANALIESLLLLARTEAQAGRRLVNKVPTDLAVGVPAALSSVRPDLERLRLQVVTDLETAPVVGDPSLLDRLAGNLIENAVRYNHAGGRVWIRTGGDAERTFIVVGNTGAEVDHAEVPGLFEPFRRGGRERTGTRGSGLGLSIVRAVADAHGGNVTARVLTTGGLEVTVTLPAADVTPVPPAPVAVSGATART